MKRLIFLLAILSLACGIQAQLPQAPQSAVKAALPTYVLTLTETPRQMTVCGAGMLNIRVSAGTDAEAKSQIPDGTIVTLTGNEAQPVVMTWYEISAPVAGWVNGKYLCEAS